VVTSNNLTCIYRLRC